MSLRNYQNQLLTAIQAPHSNEDPNKKSLIDFDQVGLNIYRNNYLASVKRSLSICYSATQKLLDDNFNIAVSCYIKQCVRQQADWAMIGEQFPDYLAQEHALVDMPFIAELARLELALFTAERALDKPLDLSTLVLLESQDSGKLAFDFASGLTLLKTNFPVNDLYQNLVNNPEIDINNAALFKILENSSHPNTRKVFHYLAIYRVNFKAHLLTITASEYLAFVAFTKFKSIDDAIEYLKNNDFELSAWLAKAIQHHMLMGVRAIKTT